ncbi:hydantoinase/oxoprolinase family protein [Paraglaciecola chathamensis]|jgi:N-methylhydantoinase A|uniref:5-oxoprolinase n=2 Tax=Paraglaciecola chathamensis TaxID=368405 RepID=A0A8H9M1Y3_9ALTE|nr:MULTISPECIES: hydantoinase/oxoprolinase family protein [Paraglaciecola]AEE24506.1 5-oxoprolinase (ATP-hydrolyzing) [Glaciecola sp. 4H-3-7+YE-5]GAC07874.1 N-methylhydantoinase A [Paraglaciecola agarilytica NO2]GGZ48511.1 5-oxoprolinase [Paraglaciecola oceanifecundans]
MKRISVDIGGTFTDCFVAWGDEYVGTKALTTHHNLAQGFNDALDVAIKDLGIDKHSLLSGVDSVRYSTTLGTNALIERKGPRIGLLITEGFNSTVPLSRGRGYGEGLPFEKQRDLCNAVRPEPIVPISMIRGVRERVAYNGDVLLPMDENDLRQKLRELVDQGAETIVVVYANSVVNPENELRTREIFLEEYPSYLLGAIPLLLSHQVAGRKGEYVRSMSTIIDGFLHQVMYHGLGTLEMYLRANGYDKPMLISHNSGGMAQLNSTDALQTVHSGPVSGIAASEHLSINGDLGNIVATDMGGTSFDIGIVVKGGEKHYDFNPVIDRWLVSIPMVHLVTLGAGGGSIASYDPLHDAVKIGPESAGSDPGPACYDRGGMQPTVTDADMLLGYLDPDNYANGRIQLNPARSRFVVEEELCDDMDMDLLDVCKKIKQTADANMANGIATELRSRGYDPSEFTTLAYGGNGPLHCCGIANALGVNRVLAPPFSSVFSALGAGNVNQMHIHEMSTYTVLFHTGSQSMLTEYDKVNDAIETLETRGRDDLMRQGMDPKLIKFRLEFDMRYGNQRVETAVETDAKRFESMHDVLALMRRFDKRYGERFGQGSQATESGVRINTIRVSSYVELDKVDFKQIKPLQEKISVEPVTSRQCYFVGFDGAFDTAVYDDAALEPGTYIEGPAVITTVNTTYLVEPGWSYHASHRGAVWFSRTNTH